MKVWETIPWIAGLPRSRPLAFRFLLPPIPPHRDYSGTPYSFPNTTSPLYIARCCRMPESGMGNSTRHPIIDLLLAPKATTRFRPPFACDFSDADGYRLGTLTALKCEFSRAGIRFLALTIHPSTPQIKSSFFDPPSLPIPPGQTKTGWSGPRPRIVSLPVPVFALWPSQSVLLPPAQNPRFSTRPRFPFLPDRRKLVGVAHGFGM